MISSILRSLFPDPRYEIPRFWSNKELKKFANQFNGSVINVSAWKDEDKQDSHYKYYFCNASSYIISNYDANARGWQEGAADQIYLDLSSSLSSELCQKFDVVFNHTTLEHIFDIQAAFASLCEMSRDIVIIVVPFLQEQHGAYGDYWRLTPLAVAKMFEKYGFELIYINNNSGKGDAVYIFAIASRCPQKWSNIREADGNKIDSISHEFIGVNATRRPRKIVTLMRYLSNRLNFLN